MPFPSLYYCFSSRAFSSSSKAIIVAKGALPCPADGPESPRSKPTCKGCCGACGATPGQNGTRVSKSTAGSTLYQALGKLPTGIGCKAAVFPAMLRRDSAAQRLLRTLSISRKARLKSSAKMITRVAASVAAYCTVIAKTHRNSAPRHPLWSFVRAVGLPVSYTNVPSLRSLISSACLPQFRKRPVRNFAGIYPISFLLATNSGVFFLMDSPPGGASDALRVSMTSTNRTPVHRSPIINTP